MNIETLKKEYDFTESRIIETSWARGFRDFILKVDYYWDRGNTVVSMPGPKQLLLICLYNCFWVQFWSELEYCQSTDMVAPDAFTIVGWDVTDDSAKMQECSLTSQGKHYHVFFQSGHNKSGRNWLEVICERVTVSSSLGWRALPNGYPDRQRSRQLLKESLSLLCAIRPRSSSILHSLPTHAFL